MDTTRPAADQPAPDHTAPAPSSATTPTPTSDTPWDVVVIGGGSGGLSAALTLVRARRRVLVLDAGAPRNRFAAHMHGVLGHDGRSPLALLATGRDEVAGYGGVIRTVQATGVLRDGDALVVTSDDGATHRTRHVVVATGLRDRLPDVPGLREEWGRGVVSCPYCDGFEVADGRIGVLATGPGSPAQAQLLRQWSARVVYLTGEVGLPDDATRRALDARGVEVVEGVVEQIWAGTDSALSVRVAGRTIDLDRLFTAPTFEPLDDVLRGLGAERADTPWGSFVTVDAAGRTSVDGLWAVGNVVNPAATVPVAIGAGAFAAAMLNHDLVEDDVRRALAVADVEAGAAAAGVRTTGGSAASDSLSTPSEAFWEQRYQGTDPAWGSRPNAALVAVLGDLGLTPGRALDLGCGHGGDAVWLAQQGWDVTATDVSATALARVDSAARAAGVDARVTTARHDLTRTLPDVTVDLVTASYFQTPVEGVVREDALRRAAARLTSGGHLVLVDHGSVAPWSWDQDATFPTPDELARTLGIADAEVVLAEARRRVASGPEGQQAEVTDTVVVLRRA
ncbi:thioredoxin reductase [Sediminihabitans luteus]|uniref:Thioredoxin reductase n=1 Tax=Sediminihabitans luteus TaxID=1138585 RepID=A0A2M9CET7_9CELL|nr:FAD-dependent oxidoreductase [Sediminihabitans luteus]PJJ70387.1 thioredoxin reductase [Sediminihabitans luteus]